MSTTTPVATVTVPTFDLVIAHRRGMPYICPSCFEPIEAYDDDIDGISIACACDAGYVTSARFRVWRYDD